MDIKNHKNIPPPDIKKKFFPDIKILYNNNFTITYKIIIIIPGKLNKNKIYIIKSLYYHKFKF